MRRHAGERAGLLLPVQKVECGGARAAHVAARVDLVQRVEPIGRGVGQRPQQHRIDDRKDGGRGADAERERHDGRGGETRPLSHLPDGVARVAAERVPPGQAARIAALFAKLRDLADFEERRTSCFVIRHPHRAIGGNLAFEVRRDLLARLLVEPVAGEKGTEPVANDAQHSHVFLLSS